MIDMVGNLSRDLERRIRADGVVVGVTAICAGRVQLVGGQPLLETVRITAEVIGAAHVASVAPQFGTDNRVLVEGHLELREQADIERLARADGVGYDYRDKTWVDVSAPKQPNPWVTLRALRVLTACT